MLVPEFNRTKEFRLGLRVWISTSPQGEQKVLSEAPKEFGERALAQLQLQRILSMAKAEV